MPRVNLVVGENDLASQRPEIAAEWHPTKNGSTQPNQVFVRSSKKAWWQCHLGHEWQAQVVTRGVSGCPVCTNRRILAGFNDLSTTHPSLAIEWNFEKNKGLSPDQLSAGSSRGIWWICHLGHEWKTSPANRSGLGTGCPFCSGRRRVEGTNDFVTTHPEIAAEWHHEKNDAVDPSKISASSNKKVWWLCTEGHEFQRVVSVRTMQGLNECPYCTARQAFKGLNDLATTHPDLARQWHPSKNGDLQSTDVTHKNSSIDIWWQCDRGHEWEASARNRSVGGTGCPYCANKRTIPGENDLASLHPELLTEWDFEKNQNIRPSEVPIGSGKRVWWRCQLGHEWRISVGARVARGSGCPYCAGVSLLQGFNDLETTNQALALEWNFEKNQPLRPSDVHGGSHKKAWWLCKQGHEWEASIASRNTGIGCAVCAGKQVLEGFNDFQSVYPQLAEEWDHEKNDIAPNEVSSSSGKLVWWVCQSGGHSWRTTPSHRGKGGRGCPSCSKGGYDPNKPGLLYFLHNDSLRAKKVGITNQKIKTARLDLFRAAGWSVLRTWERENGYLVFDTETIVLRWLRKEVGLAPYLGRSEMGSTGGWSETFFEDGVEDVEVVKKIEATLANLETM